MKPGSTLRFPILLTLLAGILIALPTSVSGQNIDAKLVDPALSPYSLISVLSNESLPHLSLYGKLSLSYVDDPLLGIRSVNVVSKLISGRYILEAAMVLGLLDRIEVGFSMPFYLRQGSKDATIVGSSASGTGMLRLHLKTAILRNRDFGGFGLGAFVEAGLPTSKRDALMGETMLHVTPGLIIDFRKRGWVVALNLAYRVRKLARTQGLVFDDEARISLGLEIPIYRRWLTLIGESVVGIQVGESLGRGIGEKEFRFPVELLSAIRWRHDSGVTMTFGAGFGATSGVTASDFRVFFSLGFGGNLIGKPTRLAALDPADKTRRPALKPPLPKPDRPGPLATVPPFVKSKPLNDATFDKLTVRHEQDFDGDGIPLHRDRCPNEPEDFDGFQDDDGCPDLDNDSDGIPDKDDKCPLQPETINGFQDEDGCPDKGIARVVVSGKRIVIKDRVYFDTGSDTLKAKSNAILNQVAQILKANQHVLLVLIEGHTDNQGDLEMNVDLSQRRAQRVMGYLIAKGVKRQRLKSKGYGPKIPIANNKSKEGKARNRRVAFRILKVRTLTPTTTIKKGGPK